MTYFFNIIMEEDSRVSSVSNAFGRIAQFPIIVVMVVMVLIAICVSAVRQVNVALNYKHYQPYTPHCPDYWMADNTKQKCSTSNSRLIPPKRCHPQVSVLPDATAASMQYQTDQTAKYNIASRCSLPWDGVFYGASVVS